MLLMLEIRGHKIFRFLMSVLSLYFVVRSRVLKLWRSHTMQCLYRKSLSYDGTSGEVLFWVPGGMPLMLHVEGAIAAAMKLRGHKVHAIICDGVFSACVQREITDQVPIEEWRKACRSCRRGCASMLDELGIDYSFIGDYVSPHELDDAKTKSSRLEWSALNTVYCGGVSVGKNIKSSILRYMKGHSLPSDSRLVQEYAYSGLVSAVSASNALVRRRPSRVFMSHGVYVDWGTALHVALAKGIPVTAWTSSYLPSRFYFRHVPDGEHIDFHNMSEDAWTKISSRVLSSKEKERLNAYIMDRYLRDVSFDMKRFKPFVGKAPEIMARYGLDHDKPIWGVLAHINWDSVSDNAPMLYDSFNEWMVDTVEVARETPEVQWLVKVHPAESWDNPDSGVDVLIRREFPELPDNIRILSAEEEVSPLDFFGLVDGAVTVYGTAGLELCIHGKPVILAGDAHYGKKGFTYDAENREDYQHLLREAGSICQLSAGQVELAKQYAYCYFILRQIPVSVVDNPASKWWAFQFKHKDWLLPGKDPAMDFLCERLLDGTDFIMSPQLEVVANKNMNINR